MRLYMAAVLNTIQKYPVGTRVVMKNFIEDASDGYEPIPNGASGIVEHVDAVGIIHVLWEGHRRLGVYPEEIDLC